YREFMRRLRALLGFMVPGFLAEGKAYLAVAVGCTGGQHRSVVVADELATFFRDKGLPVSVDHRDLDRGETG
ncbi:MAG TPA: RNase adapter RapZ, partial [Actinomycetota bacterium]